MRVIQLVKVKMRGVAVTWPYTKCSWFWMIAIRHCVSSADHGSKTQSQASCESWTPFSKSLCSTMECTEVDLVSSSIRRAMRLTSWLKTSQRWETSSWRPRTSSATTLSLRLAQITSLVSSRRDKSLSEIPRSSLGSAATSTFRPLWWPLWATSWDKQSSHLMRSSTLTLKLWRPLLVNSWSSCWTQSKTLQILREKSSTSLSAQLWKH